MNKIEFDRIGVDGNTYSQEKIEKHFCSNFERKIADRLKLITATGLADKMVGIIKNHLHKLLFAPPILLDYWRVLVDRYRNVLSNNVLFNGNKMRLDKALLNAFYYENYRKRKGMFLLAKMLNVKSCPYCNMHYTLYAENKDGKKRYAKLQFDHFIDKASYPMFSMSLYNLIPSCGVCNNSKKNQVLSLAYHPYYADIHRNFYLK